MTKAEIATLSLNAKGKHYGTIEGDGKEKKKPQIVGFFQLFRMSDVWDRIAMVLGTVVAIVSGFGFPLIVVTVTYCMDSLINVGKVSRLIDSNPAFLALTNLSKGEILKDPTRLKPLCNDTSFGNYNQTRQCQDVRLDIPMLDEIRPYLVYYARAFVSVFCHCALWAMAAERQAHRIRHRIFQNVLRQDIGWFDVNDTRELNSRIISDINVMRKGMGECVGIIIQTVIIYLVSFVLGVMVQPQLAGVMFAFSLLLVSSVVVFSYVSAFIASKEGNVYAKAGSVAQEVLGSIRTVIAFGGEDKETERYKRNLKDAKQYSRNKGIVHGLFVGLFFALRLLTYALGLWYGGFMVRNGMTNPRDVIMTLFSILVGVVCICGIIPDIRSVSEARGSAHGIFTLIEQVPKIDSSSKTGIRLENFRGDVRFDDVHFCYPSRPNTKVLKGMHLEVKAGQTLALVGSSGCGKTTLFQLLLRFYDPQRGQITVDGCEVTHVNIQWLRHTIGLVSQEPYLFDTTIAQNIRYGREEVSKEDIEEAARKANAYDFISKLPQKFDTLVGERGAKLSGGQKQRIAIARALVRNPKILLLDEATSALDTDSESIVQDALDKARHGRTTLIIAHRLSTIRTADVIVGIEGGVVKEKGTHAQLMAIGGIYHNLVTNQTTDKVIDEVKGSPGEYFKPIWKEGQTDRSLVHGVSEVDGDESSTTLPLTGFVRLILLNSREWYLVTLGCIGAILFGLLQPAYAIIIGELFSVFQKDEDQWEYELNKWSLILIGIGFLNLASSLLQGWMLSLAGGALTQRLRVQSFRAMLKQGISWFDDPCNNAGALSNRLAVDTAKVQEASAANLALNLQAVVALGGAIILSFIYCGWKLTIVSAVALPFVMLAGTANFINTYGNTVNNKASLESVSKIVIETVENMKTVASLTREETFLNMYMSRLSSLQENTKRMVGLQAAMFGLSHSVIFFQHTVIFSYGAYLVNEQEMTSDGVIKVFTIFLMCGVFASQTMSSNLNITQAKTSARKVFGILDRTPEVDMDSFTGEKPDESSFRNTVTFQEANFRYPARADAHVLKGLEFKVEAGHTVALVGSSGGGKTTVVSLLQRFYDLQSGRVTIGCHDIRDFNVKWLRSQIGLVSQEPVLFDCTIAENIAYGDNTRVVSINEIIQAATMANIHKFIQALPKGYDTEVGDKGTQLSVGQKQRVAIARALVRNPKILLLDEATSALDTESEKIVQEALTKARQGRTCIIIAHRLSTVQDADKIIFIHQGRVLEQGTHKELMALRGFYHRMYSANSKHA